MVSSQRYIHSGTEDAYLQFCMNSFIEKKYVGKPLIIHKDLEQILLRSTACFPLNVCILYKVTESLPEVKQ